MIKKEIFLIFGNELIGLVGRIFILVQEIKSRWCRVKFKVPPCCIRDIKIKVLKQLAVIRAILIWC